MERVRLVALAAPPIKESAASATSLTTEQVVAEFNRFSAGARKNLPTYLKGETMLEFLTRSVLVGLGHDADAWQRHAKLVEEATRDPKNHPFECECALCL
jgi:hypothetical protein